MIKPEPPLVASVNALGANTTLTYIMTTVMNYPPIRKKNPGYEDTARFVQTFSDGELLEMAWLVMHNAAIDNKQAIAKAASKCTRKFEAKLTAAEVQGGLIWRAQRFLDRGMARDPKQTAHRLRQFALI